MKNVESINTHYTSITSTNGTEATHSEPGQDGKAAPDNSSLVDLNKQLVKNKESTFVFKINGDAMVGAGIFSGDILLVDRSITNVNGKVVVAVLNGEMMVRRLEKTINRIRLIPETQKLAAIEVDPFAEFMVWGVVTYNIHMP